MSTCRSLSVYKVSAWREVKPLVKCFENVPKMLFECSSSFEYRMFNVVVTTHGSLKSTCLYRFVSRSFLGAHLENKWPSWTEFCVNYVFNSIFFIPDNICFFSVVTCMSIGGISDTYSWYFFIYPVIKVGLDFCAVHIYIGCLEEHVNYLGIQAGAI